MKKCQLNEKTKGVHFKGGALVRFTHYANFSGNSGVQAVE